MCQFRKSIASANKSIKVPNKWKISFLVSIKTACTKYSLGFINLSYICSWIEFNVHIQILYYTVLYSLEIMAFESTRNFGHERKMSSLRILHDRADSVVKRQIAHCWTIHPFPFKREMDSISCRQEVEQCLVSFRSLHISNSRTSYSTMDP